MKDAKVTLNAPGRINDYYWEECLMDLSSKFLASLGYFSILFAPVILPLLVYFLVDKNDIKHHAKRAFISHLLSFLVVILGTILYIIFDFSIVMSASLIIGFIITGVLFIASFKWNIAQGINVFF